MASATKETPTLKVHCNTCRTTTNHKILKSAAYFDEDREQGIGSQTKYHMLVCCGCDDVVLRRWYFFSEDDEPTISFFPPRVSRWVPQWRWTLPPNIRTLLTETYTALQANSRKLATMGIRSTIELAMINKVGDHGAFDRNLQALETQGHLSKKNREFLAVALEAGHAVTHRGHTLSEDDLKTVMDIAENMLQSLFSLDKAADRLKKSIPPRPPRKAPSAKP